jgi:hypothetical protein
MTAQNRLATKQVHIPTPNTLITSSLTVSMMIPPFIREKPGVGCGGDQFLTTT